MLVWELYPRHKWILQRRGSLREILLDSLFLLLLLFVLVWELYSRNKYLLGLPHDIRMGSHCYVVSVLVLVVLEFGGKLDPGHKSDLRLADDILLNRVKEAAVEQGVLVDLPLELELELVLGW